MYELISLLKPFESHPGNPQTSVCKGQRPQIPISFTPCLFQRIMKVCWNQNPDDRPSMAQIVEWSQFPELQSLRTIHQLEPRKLLGICQCQVVQDDVHQPSTIEPKNLQHIPSYERFNPLFSSLSSQTPQSKRKHAASTQIWIAQDVKDEAIAKVTIVTFRSSDLGYYVRCCVACCTNVLFPIFLYRFMKTLLQLRWWL